MYGVYTSLLETIDVHSARRAQKPRPRPLPRPPRPRPRSVPRPPRPRPRASSFLRFFGLGASSTRSVSSGSESGRTKYRTLLPRMDKESRETGSRFRVVILTVFKCVFICISTPVIVPCTIDPFLSSIVTVSLFNFIKNRTSFMIGRVQEITREYRAEIGRAHV